MTRTILSVISLALLGPASATCQFIGTIPRVYYSVNDQVEELWWDRTDNTWHARAIGQEAKAPPISDSLDLPTGFGVGPNLDPHVYYGTANSQLRQLQVEQLAWMRGNNTWQARNISQEVNAPGR